MDSDDRTVVDSFQDGFFCNCLQCLNLTICHVYESFSHLTGFIAGS